MTTLNSFYALLFVLLSIIILIFDNSYADMNNYDSQKLITAHEKIVDLIYENSESIQQLESNTTSTHLPILLSYIDNEKNELVVTMNYDTVSSNDFHIQQINSIVGEDISLNLNYGVFVEYGSCDAPDESCDPLIGGLQHTDESNFGGTTTLPFTLKDGRAGILTSGHIFDNTDLVYQPGFFNTDAGIIGQVIFDTRPDGYDSGFTKSDSAFILANSGIHLEKKIFKDGWGFLQCQRIS